MSSLKGGHHITKLLQLMTKRLSDDFFGDKRITQKVHAHLIAQGSIEEQDICMIFEPATSKFASIKSEDGSISLLDIFVQFVKGSFQEFSSWPFAKMSSVVEISAHVFQYSFMHWLGKQQSFKYFSQVLVRHSLFRPPHSVCIFNYEQLDFITQWWLIHFDRYYEQYKTCIASNLNEILICQSLPFTRFADEELKEGKPIDKSQILKFLV